MWLTGCFKMDFIGKVGVAELFALFVANNLTIHDGHDHIIPGAAKVVADSGAVIGDSSDFFNILELIFSPGYDGG
jgi:hypothetical protein